MRILRGRVKNAELTAAGQVRCMVLGLEDEEIEDVELFNDHGSTALPDDDSECIAIQFGHRTIVVAGADRRIAPAMQPGDVAIHNDSNQYVIIKKSGGIDIRTSQNVTVYANQIRLGDNTLLPTPHGIVTCQAACSYAGLHAQGSLNVMAKG